jgi:hypothetical protein
MSVEQDSVSVQNNEAWSNIEVLRGRTGIVVKVLSERQAVIRDNVYGDFTFTDDVVAFSEEEKGTDFISHFPVGKVVYFDIEVDDAGCVRCTEIWMKKKQKADFSCSDCISVPLQTGDLVENKEYKGKVIKMRPPFAFVVEVGSSKMPVFVFNQAFRTNRNAPKLQKDEPVSHYVSKGDTVCVKVYRRSGRKEFAWSAWDAWLEDSNASEPSTRSEDPFCRVIKKRRKRTLKTKQKTSFMKGRLRFLDTETAHLESTDCNDIVFFHRDNAFLFGVPIKGLRLDHIFRIGMVVILKCEHSSIIIL